MASVWPIVHRERHALIGDLEGLDEEQWAHPSLCSGWTVHDVVAHLVDTARTTRLSFVVGLARARFDFHRQNASGVAQERGASPAETLARLRSVASRTSTPPAPLDSRIVEEVVHGEDIRRPLGITRDYPDEAVVRALRLQARTPVSFGGAKEHLSGLRLLADDVADPDGAGDDVAVDHRAVTIGGGAAVEGPALSLLLAISGRTVALADLRGPGLPALAARIA